MNGWQVLCRHCKEGRALHHPHLPHMGILAHSLDHQTLHQESRQPLQRSNARQTSGVSASSVLSVGTKPVSAAGACVTSCLVAIASAASACATV